MPPSASSNWLKLQKTINPTGKSKAPKRRKHDKTREKSPSPTPSQSSHAQHEDSEAGPSSAADNSPKALRKMVEGHVVFTEKQRQPGKYLAVDCEMVGVGLEGEESSLARVSIVNFYGATVLDEFVKQRERVVDYRTQWSGIRPSDMVNARPFAEVQKLVAELLENRILVGHAVHNDLKALLLSHPYPLTRDTQVLAFKSKATKSKRIALRNLVKQELDLTIQSGEHSSVTDARATMAVYRIHKKAWDKLLGAFARTDTLSLAVAGKRKAEEEDEEEEDEPRKAKKVKGVLPGPEGRKGVSSGLSTVVRRGSQVQIKGKGKGRGASGAGGGGEDKAQWWAQLPSSSSGAKKGSMKL
ncbi:ribonuclease H-like domain-containing protein [Ephemerocybe angulata]|uniref:RNA exonuclease 4 n=1 Tax=Ephemerocybe angulata TaxID=980116 RepID=A0A8H6HS66_9AGAR|nr:ribonuclease H-like domain-containing protein [Tulosesus angulatus]